jgi:site-specific DNA-cytosine methylase
MTTRSSRSASTHRYRCCGNGVVAPVAEWLGARLAEALA